MINNILHTPWSFMRWIRLVIGSYLVFVGVADSDMLAGGIGVVLAFLALFNQGCGGGICSIPQQKK